MKIRVNGVVHRVSASSDKPLLYVLRNELHLIGPRFGLWAKERKNAASAPALHPLQQAWIDVDVPQCGYCQSGMLIQAADLLSTTKHPTEDQIRVAMNGHLCRCGTYPKILRAIKQAAAVMAKEVA